MLPGHGAKIVKCCHHHHHDHRIGEISALVHHKKTGTVQNQNHRQMISAQTSVATYCASSPYYLEVVTTVPTGSEYVE